MSSVQIRLPDNSIKSFDHNPTILDVAKSIGEGLAKSTVGGLVNGHGEILDLRTELKDGDQLSIITAQSEQGREVLRHSAAHIMAQAVQELYKDVKVTIGPVVETGFYYDFDPAQPFTLEDLPKIEKKMKEIIKRNLPVQREVWPSEKAIQVFTDMGETFKAEIIRDLGEQEVSVYRQGEWFDLCRGPHVQSTGQVKSVKVMSLAGAYWRGDQNNKQLQRVYGTAFFDKKEMNDYLHFLEEAKKRDHRKVGKDLGLFMFHEWAPGMPFFSPKGTIIYNQLTNYIRDCYKKYNYSEVITPQIYDVNLYKTSGHYDHYQANMYFSDLGEKGVTGVKPMNCPGHCLLYASERHSYRELPIRIADFGRLHRYEASGALHGLTRVRSMCQDDAHIFCTQAQMQPEIRSFMEMLKEIYDTLGLNDFKVYVATRPEDRMGSDEVWDLSEKALTDALDQLNIAYEISPGDGAFYGPKIEIHFVDVMKRTWQLGTMQVDFNMPKNFDLTYVGEDNSEHRPVMLHRAILGTLERFIGIYIEHTDGRFPLWLCPNQISLLNVTDRQADYCRSLKSQLEAQDIRCHFDDRNEKLGYKIREAQLQKTPYMAIIGDKEMADNQVSVRLADGQMSPAMSIDDLINFMKQEIQTKSRSPLIPASSGQ
jgi:threonyl-tRNA synthetase